MEACSAAFQGWRRARQDLFITPDRCQWPDMGKEKLVKGVKQGSEMCVTAAELGQMMGANSAQSEQATPLGACLRQ